jgi:hypothetical protein
VNDQPYDPQPGSVPFRVIAWLEQQPDGSEFTTSHIAEALGLLGPHLHTCLEPALRHGALHARRRDGHRTAPRWWSLSPRAPASVAVALPRAAVPPPPPAAAPAPAAAPPAGHAEGTPRGGAGVPSRDAGAVSGAGRGAAVSTDAVNHPAHYGGADNPYEAIRVIEAWGLGFCLGNTVKYIRRAEKKGAALEDLRKALWYLQREIERRTARSEDLVRTGDPGGKTRG